jgi:membrane-associated phospholipid phosphatase
MSRFSAKTVLSSLIFVILCAVIFTQFLAWNESRANNHGFVFDDPVYGVLPLKDLSMWIFTLTYGAIILYAILNRQEHYFFSRAVISYSFILLFRIPSMLILPLKVHPDLIFLQDPFLNDIVYPSKIVNDLFFSGHVALVSALAILSKIKWPFIAIAFLLALSLLVQRVHYSIDILASVPFAWLSVRISQSLLLKYSKAQK